MIVATPRVLIRAMVLLLLTAASGGAQLPGQPRSQPLQRIRAALPAYPDPVALDTVAQYKVFKAPMGAIFTAANDALKELDIPITARDSAHGIVGSLYYTKMRRIAGKQMSQAMNCGSGMTGPNADSYRIYLATLVMMEGLPNGDTKVAIALVSSAQDIQGAAKDPVTCGTSGYVENQIEELIRKKLKP
jgi:hypothetical protein